MKTVHSALAAFPLAALAGLGGCTATIPKDALALHEESLAERQLQTRRFDTGDEQRLLVAGAGLLQDLGYTVDSSQPTLGVIVASKSRDATDGGQVVGAVVIAALLGVRSEVDRDQKIRVSLVTTPHGGYTTLRATFQRVVWNTAGQVSRAEFVGDPKIYQEFFEKLSKAVFLEANQI